ncbi:hypothetical protein CZ787_03570 [Halomonas citrativorans]|uniref:Uncharacterized protein n=1 Tax=Halomonas citrativorans TaxID=2742612 RepID=A0A1R4HSR4_9GAMM|nr:hypothetical protein CZ787_03570 [Halomonas citrativorans]
MGNCETGRLGEQYVALIKLSSGECHCRYENKNARLKIAGHFLH